MRFTIGRACFSAVLALGALALVSPGRLAAQGEVTGRVTDKTSGAGLAGAQVSVVGTTIRGLSGQDGRFRLANVPAGAATVRVAFIGYSTVTQPVTVTAGGSGALDLGPAAAGGGL